MLKNVLKRDGRIVSFEKEKIVSAIIKAFENVDGDATQDDSKIASNIADKIESKNEDFLGVEDIQDCIEKLLMKSKRSDVAKAYIIYRNDRNRERQNKSLLMKNVADKLKASNVRNQNANVDEKSFGGRMGETTEVITKEYALNNIVSEMARNNHLNNEIYIHDLGHYAIGDHNCLSVPLDDLLAKGFNTRQTDVRPAQSVNTAFQLVAVIFQLQSLQQFGGVSATHLDWTMVPYVRKSFYKHYCDGLKYFNDWTDSACEDMKLQLSQKEYSIGNKEGFYTQKEIGEKPYRYALDMTEKEVYQAVEGFYHNLNTLQSRSGNQLPFSSVNYGTCTLPEGRMVIKALLNISIKGIGKLHKTSIFPCGIFQCMKGVNRKPGDSNYDLFQLALKSTAQRLYPNYANVNWSGNEGFDENDPETYFSTMGCRTANGWDINGFGQMKDGRGNICPTTIIMPTLAMEAKEKIEEESKYTSFSIVDGTNSDNINDYTVVKEFMSLLDKKIHEAKDMLLERFEYICSQSPESAKFMYENGTMRGYIPEEGIRSALKHGTLAIGQIGLAETLQILIGKDHTTDEGMQLAKRIESLFNKRCNEFKQKYKLNFGVYYTPAENMCYTTMTKFRKKYGIIPNISEHKFFTNSIHVPVWKEMTPFEKIDIESQLTGYSSAGCITYVELNAGVKNNLEVLEQIVNYAMDKDIPYFAINVPNDMCAKCGYTDEINDECPMCGGKEIRRLRRVTGYLTGDYKTAFNEGKQEETELRVKHW